MNKDAVLVSFTGHLKRVAKKSKMAIIAHTIYNNWQARRRFNSGNIETSSGVIHTRMSLSESMAYIHRVFEDYLKYSGLSMGMLRHKRILILGPGDNYGVALRFLTAGAKQVLCIDKFSPKRNLEQEQKLYHRLRDELHGDERQNFDATININNGKIEINTQKLLPIHGLPIEKAEKRIEPGSFDLIVSRAVMEHLYDPDKAFSVLDRLLVSGGHMIHKIDLRDHGIFTDSGFHPLTFLTVPDSVYRLMTSDSGRPNRRLISYYRRKIAEFGYDAKVLITHVVGGEGEIESPKDRISFGVDYSAGTLALLDRIRPKLQAEFREMSDEELLVSGIFLTARKPCLKD